MLSKLRAAIPDMKITSICATPASSWEVIDSPPDPEAMNVLYTSEGTALAVSNTVQDRIARKEWSDAPNITQKMVKQSKDNLRFCKSIVSACDAHVTFPYATRTGEQAHPPLTLLDSIVEPGYPNIVEKPLIMCNQVRVIYSTPADEKFKHETIMYSTTAFPVDPCGFDAVPDECEIEARFVRVGINDHGCTLYVLPDRKYDGRVLTDQHLTINAGCGGNGAARPPATMRLVANALINAESNVAVADTVLDLSSFCEDRLEKVRPLGWVVDTFVLS